MTDWMIFGGLSLVALAQEALQNLYQQLRVLKSFWMALMPDKSLTVQQAMAAGDLPEEPTLEGLQKKLLAEQGWELFYYEDTYPVMFHFREKTLEEKLEEYWFGKQTNPNTSAWVKFTENGDCVRVEHTNAWAAVAYELNRLLEKESFSSMSSKLILPPASCSLEFPSTNSNVSSRIDP